MQTVDFIVIGSGIAGLNSALVLAAWGRVLVVTKARLSDSATYLAQGGIAAAQTPPDTPAAHARDTLDAGGFHNHPAAVRLLTSHGRSAVERLTELGVRFDVDTSFEAAHRYPRVHRATDFTGRQIHQALSTAVGKHPNISIREHAMAVDLIVANSTCFGVQVIQKNRVVPIFSRCVVLATGGAGQLYQWTTNPPVATGDGIALAHRAGAKLSDLEFVQFHPTALREDASPLFLLSEALRGEGAVLIKSKVKSPTKGEARHGRPKSEVKGERFMRLIDPRAELAPRDVVARAIFAAQQRGYTVYLDIRHKAAAFITARFPNIYRTLIGRGYDLAVAMIPVTPAAHFMCGGVATDLHGQTSVKRLFAVGEVAATGVHGANRLASNSLLEGMVFSQQIADCVYALPKKAVQVPVRTVRYNTDAQPQRIGSRLQRLMWDDVGIVRTAQRLRRAVRQLEQWQKNTRFAALNEGVVAERNMIQAALQIARAAQQRKDSLGAHYME